MIIESNLRNFYSKFFFCFSSAFKNKKWPVYKDFFLHFKHFVTKIHNSYLSHEIVHLNLCAYCICSLEFIITNYNPLIPSSFLIYSPLVYE